MDAEKKVAVKTLTMKDISQKIEMDMNRNLYEQNITYMNRICLYEQDMRKYALWENDQYV